MVGLGSPLRNIIDFDILFRAASLGEVGDRQFSQVADDGQLHVARMGIRDAERLAVCHAGTPIHGIPFHQVPGFQFLPLVRSQEPYPCENIPVINGNGIIARHAFGVHLHVGAVESEVCIIVLHLADIHGMTLVVGNALCRQGVGTNGENQVIAHLEQLRQQLAFNVRSCVHEGTLQLLAQCQHLVTHDIDLLALAVATLGQHLHRTLIHLEFMVIDGEYTAIMRCHALIGGFADSAHGSGLINHRLHRHADIHVGIRAYAEQFRRSADALSRLESIIILQ